MAAGIVALAMLMACVRLASGQGTVVELHKFTFFVGDPVWVVPDPTTAGSPGAPLGCTNLATAFSFQSGRFFWNVTAGKSLCHFIWFFFDTNCQGGARGVQATDPPKNSSDVWVSQDAIYSRTTYWKIQNGKSIGCSFETDPCEAFPCEDPNAQCNSTYGWSWKDEQGKSWASQQRDCSVCKDGFVHLNGSCTTPAEACAKLACPAPTTCATDADAPYCKCPVGYALDKASGACKEVAKDAWLNPLNNVRDEAATSAGASSAAGLQKSVADKPPPLEWDNNLAAVAKNWTVYLNSTQCGVDPVVLSKIPGGNYSESDVWVSWSSDESEAVQLWAPSPADSTNPRTARITNQGSQLTGCGKTVCGSGAFFTCLFWPKTS